MTEKDKLLLKRYFLVVIICLIIFIPLTVFGVWLYTQKVQSASSNTDGKGDKEQTALETFFKAAPSRTNFVILGVDDDSTRTDVMMVGSFKKETGEINLMSLPRDTYVEMSEEHRQILKDENSFVPKNGAMKLNQVHHYAGKTHGTDFIVSEIENLLGFQIDYYAKVDLDAFKYIVNEMGGVEFNVPQRMFYNDPTQNLHIDLMPGLQTLTGEQAEGLVRYRKSDAANPISAGYANGDLKRVEIQQDFVKALVNQMLTKENLINNSGAILNTVIKYVETNFNIADAPKYLKYIKNLSSMNIQSVTIPVENISYDGQSYVKIKEPEARAVIESVFMDAPELTAEEKSSLGKEIIVLNGSGKKGAAKHFEDVLVSGSFLVTSIGDYDDNRTDQTRIFVKKRGMGEDLQPYFKNSEIITDISLSDCDIKIVVGRNEEADTVE